MASQGRTLEELSVAEVGQLLEKFGFDRLKPIFAANLVTGRLLSCCDDFNDLQTADFGVTNTAIAKGLMKMINEWKVNGVQNV